MPEDQLEKLYNSIDRKREGYLDMLKAAVAIRSVTGDYSEARKILSWAETKLKDLDAKTTTKDVGSIVIDGKKISLPPVLIADFKSESSSQTLLVYGHLDVRPSSGPTKSTNSSRDSYDLMEESGSLFGKGVTDSKGPLLCWFNAIQAYKEGGIDIPINIRFMIEAMKESGSVGLMEFIYHNKGFLFQDVSFICISDSSCLAASKPVLTHGLRGCCKFLVTIEGAKTHLHSGAHGGMIFEPMTDMVSLLSALVNSKGDILIPNINDNVEDVTPEEEKAVHRLSFDVQSFKQAVGVERLMHKEDKKRLLMHRSRFPSLSIQGIHTGEDIGNDIIPCKVVGSFTIRIVPNQTPDKIFHSVQLYLMYLFNKLQSPNRMTIEMPVALPPWLAKPTDLNYKAAITAIQKVYKQDPDLIREGSSISIVPELERISGKSILLLPVGYSDHSITKNRDRISVKTFMDGTKVIATYIYELSKIKRSSISK